jgi:hypothetical protein
MWATLGASDLMWVMLTNIIDILHPAAALAWD